MNQRYASSAVVAAGGDEIWERDRELYLQPTTRPGAKMPHAWLVDEQGLRLSSLDVVGHGKFTLVTGIGGRAWVEAAATLDLPYLRTTVIGGPGSEDPYRSWASAREMDEAGALLVRPDGYIAWRHAEAVWNREEASVKLTDTIRSVLGQES